MEPRRWQKHALPLLAVLGASAGLLAHAARFDFVCDDAFITLRYAENLARLGSPVYNVGERVEGYTNFLWMVLVAIGTKFGAHPVSVVRGLGAIAGVGLVAASSVLYRRSAPGRTWGVVPFLAAIAVSAPIAAWTLSGLETPLFAALAVLGLALASDVVTDGATPRAAALAGVVLALATLTRPEGALFFGIAFLAVSLARLHARAGWRPLLALGAAYAAIVVPFVAWRWHYYGYPLPNTFYLKSSGDPAELRAHGARYVAFAAGELGLPFLAVAGLSFFVPSRSGDDDEARRQRVLLRIARVLVVLFVPYVISVGGDFLDLYRFFVPLLPLVFASIAGAIDASLVRVHESNDAKVAVAAFVSALVALYGAHDRALGDRALLESEPGRGEHGIEPLGWTRLYAKRWGSMGRWLAAHSAAGDSLAVGAAGAMPYYSRLPNLDTFGLCDAFVAHEGQIIGSRPGHQRFAPESYVASRHPTFLLVGTDFTTDAPLPSLPVHRDDRWERRGYVWVEAHVDAARYDAPSSYYHYVLVDRAAAERLRGRADARVPTL